MVNRDTSDFLVMAYIHIVGGGLALAYPWVP